MSHSHSHGHENCDHSHQNTQLVETKPRGDESSIHEASVSDTVYENIPRQFTFFGEFIRLQNLYFHISSDNTGSDSSSTSCSNHDLAKHVSDANTGFASLLHRLKQSGEFIESNERVDEVSTDQINYLLIEFYLASLKYNHSSFSPTNRYQSLLDSKLGFEAFLDRCIQAGLFTPEEMMQYGIAEYQSQKAQFEASYSDAEPLDLRKKRYVAFQSKREHKVARFQSMSQERKQLAGLVQAQRARARMLEREGELDGVGAVTYVQGGGTASSSDDDTVRKLTLLRVRIACKESVDSLYSISGELPLAEVSRAISTDDAAKEAYRAVRSEEDAKLKENQARGLEVTRINPRLEITREVVRAQVFTNSIPQPTVSFEEWGDIVTAKRIEKEQREAAQAEVRIKGLDELRAEGLEYEDDQERFDLATKKARDFDDWKDGVPKGSGVTKRV
jgi:TAP42-like family